MCQWPCKHAQEICSNGCFRGGGPGLKLVVSGFQFLTLPSIVLRWQRHISLMQNLDNHNDSKKQHGVFPQRPAALLELLLLLLLSIIFRHPGFRLDEWDHLHWLYIHLYHSLHDIPRHPNCHLPRFGIYWTPPKKRMPWKHPKRNDPKPAVSPPEEAWQQGLLHTSPPISFLVEGTLRYSHP